MAGAEQRQLEVHLVHQALDLNRAVLRRSHLRVEPRQLPPIELLVLGGARMEGRGTGGDGG